ncbi:MAG: CopD family protein [Bacteroidetes bacterium]|nr:MAG: CopD family protein [Bacteroidota bacterium]
MDLSVIKALHIIFVVSWFAGLFYMVRLFIYHVEALDRPEQEARILTEQFRIMQRKLWYIITTPAMVLTVLFGVWMLILYPYYLDFTWMRLKLGFVVILLLYHFVCQYQMNLLKKDALKWSSSQLRLWNELATLLLVAIVFLVELQHSFNWIKGTVIFFVVGLVLMFAVKAYKRYRQKSK